MTESRVPLAVEPDWLEARLNEPDLRVLDCTFHIAFDPDTGERSTTSGRSEWEESHIPGSVHVDIPNEFSVTHDPRFPYEFPPPEQFAQNIGRLGIGDESRVVLYDAAGSTKAARFWWMLRAVGFDDAGILNGGWTRWIAEDRPVSSEPSSYEPATFTPSSRSELIATKDEVVAQMTDPDTCLVNALRPEDFAGTAVVKYGRPGRIPESVNVPAVGEDSFIDPDTQEFESLESLERRFASVGATNSDRVITYCGGGIAASAAAFALACVGVDDVAVYDGSLAEWGRIPDLPMETDTDP